MTKGRECELLPSVHVPTRKRCTLHKDFHLCHITPPWPVAARAEAWGRHPRGKRLRRFVLRQQQTHGCRHRCGGCPPIALCRLRWCPARCPAERQAAQPLNIAHAPG
eukprot:357233-Chlamydomonas_euryale.AAC.14